ncbi:acetamidase/formamidase [Klebsormidium nitens]|uniref:Acetamidase/formamidase n=1 Tax=Klebsormidium nitens TaxID=105231 RepID=A0A1Y1HW37_KLENI|nr:acetamidase/formamidase [Klebsormidium nitens]|eukprot:GAQ82864.1 acetamidase/formamidase [Klebsormidium nitens]
MAASNGALFLVGALLICCVFVAPALAQGPAAAPTSPVLPGNCSAPSTRYVAANKDTVRWGFYDLFKDPVAYVQSGDIITVEVITHEAGNEYAKMIQGDPGIEDIYYWPTNTSVTEKNVPQYPGSGAHIVTGPIYVCGAEPGDVLQVEILSIKPRLNPVSGKCYGVNRIANFGYIARPDVGHRDGTPWNDSTITVYEINEDKEGWWATPQYQFTVPKTIDPAGRGNLPMQNVDGGVIVPHAVDYGVNSNAKITYPVGFQTILNQSDPIAYTAAADLDFRIPLRPHTGVMGVMPANGQNYLKGAPNGTMGANTIPPSRFGGNVDDWRIGAGATMYYTIEEPGAKFVIADTHAAQGDSELSGTAIETSMTVTVRITTIKQADLPPEVSKLTFPLLETATEYVVHGYNYLNYLDELPVPSTVGSPGFGDDLNLAFKNAFNETRSFLMDLFALTENEAVTIMSTAVDYSISQVVDANWGVHGSIRKSIFSRRVGNRKLLEFYAQSHGIERSSTTLLDTARARNALKARAAAAWSLPAMLRRLL